MFVGIERDRSLAGRGDKFVSEKRSTRTITTRNGDHHETCDCREKHLGDFHLDFSLVSLSRTGDSGVRLKVQLSHFNAMISANDSFSHAAEEESRIQTGSAVPSKMEPIRTSREVSANMQSILALVPLVPVASRACSRCTLVLLPALRRHSTAKLESTNGFLRAPLDRVGLSTHHTVLLLLLCN